MTQLEVFGKPLPGEKEDWLYIGASCLLILICSTLLYFDFKRRGSGVGGEQVGTISFKHKVAQRQLENQVIWDELEQETPVYNKDRIRTGEVSEAVITLRDGTKISLDESSMILVSFTDKSADITFNYGSVQAARDSKSGDNLTALNIKTQDNKVISIQNSDVKLSRTEGEELSLTVQRGTASVALSDGKTQTVGKDQRAVISEQISVKKVILRPTSPGDGFRSYITEAQKPFEFVWERPAEPVTFEIASDRQFAKIVSRQTTPGDRAVAALGDGTYFWRLSSIDKAGKADFSDLRKITVIRNAPSGLLSPADGSRFEYVTEEPLVNFSWTKSEVGQAYKLEVAKDPSFASADVIETSSTSISRKYPTGKYFFRVTTVSEGTNASSTPGSFTIVRKEKTSPPVPVRGADSIGGLMLQKEGMALYWSASKDIAQTKIQISSSENFSNVVFNGASDTNFINVKENLKEGKYFWRVQGIDRAGSATEFSGALSFVVTGAEKISLRSPNDATELDPVQTRQDGIGFLWDGPDLAQFQLVVSVNPNLEPAAVKEIVAGKGRIVRTLGAGKYFWRVRLLSQQGGVLTESDVRSFFISDSLTTPVLLDPQKGQTVDMTDREELYFRWNPVKGADGYDFTLFRGAGAIRQPILNLKLQRSDFLLRDLGILDVGQFSWAVSAYGRNQISDISTSDFGIILRMDNSKPVITSPGVQYTE